MKKTITLLLAAASVAIAATDITDSINWTSDHTATMNALSDDMSIAFTLNWDKLDYSNKQTLFTAYGPGSKTETAMYGVGMGIFYSKADGYDLNSIHVAKSSVQYTGGYSNITEMLKYKVTDAVLVYTFDKDNQSNDATGTFGGTLYLWLDSNETPLLSIYAGYNQNTYVGSLEYLEFDAELVNIESVRLYDGLVEDSPEFAKTIKDTNIPEPTTATLSLLALAGLAARRRRR